MSWTGISSNCTASKTLCVGLRWLPLAAPSSRTSTSWVGIARSRRPLRHRIQGRPHDAPSRCAESGTRNELGRGRANFQHRRRFPGNHSVVIFSGQALFSAPRPRWSEADWLGGATSHPVADQNYDYIIIMCRFAESQLPFQFSSGLHCACTDHDYIIIRCGYVWCQLRCVLKAISD